jgi:hypothetical protein
LAAHIKAKDLPMPVFVDFHREIDDFSADVSSLELDVKTIQMSQIVDYNDSIAYEVGLTVAVNAGDPI